MAGEKQCGEAPMGMEQVLFGEAHVSHFSHAMACKLHGFMYDSIDARRSNSCASREASGGQQRMIDFTSEIMHDFAQKLCASTTRPARVWSSSENAELQLPLHSQQCAVHAFNVTR